MAVCPGLCWSSVTLSSTARKGEGGEGREKNKKQKTVNSEKQVRHFEISPFFIIYCWGFFFFFPLYGNSKISEEISTAFESATCGLGMRTSLSYVWGLATGQTTTHVNNILDWVMTWWIMKVSHETSFQHQQWPSKKHLDDLVRCCIEPGFAKLEHLSIPV